MLTTSFTIDTKDTFEKNSLAVWNVYATGVSDYNEAVKIATERASNLVKRYSTLKPDLFSGRGKLVSTEYRIRKIIQSEDVVLEKTHYMAMP